MMKNAFILAIALLVVACGPARESETTKKTDAAPIEEIAVEPTLLLPLQNAHGMQALAKQEVLEGHLVLSRGGSPSLDARMWISIGGNKVRMELADSAKTILVFDGTECWTNQAASATPQNRFHLLTWSYFLMAPFKLTDPGTQFAITEPRPLLDGTLAPTGRLTFESGVGDTPDDWYVVYQDPDSKLLKAMSYIVTFNSAAEEAEPHAIVYSDYQAVEGVQLSTRWNLYNWSESEGFGESLGVEITFTNPSFISSEADMFAKPTNGFKLPMPGQE